jgi:hypothetical protein
LGNLGLGRAIFNWVLERRGFRIELNSSGSGNGPEADSYEHCNDPSGSMNDGEYLEQLSEYQLLKELVG